MSTLTPAELDDRREDEGVFVLDVRPADAYERGHVEGSYNAPIYDRVRRGETDAIDDYLDDVPADAEVVTVCKAGVVARDVTDALAERGYDATTLTGGYAGWRGYEENTLLYRVLSTVHSIFR